MSADRTAAEPIGGGRAPGRRGRKAQLASDEVLRVPYWVPWDQDGKGSWRLVARSRTHNVELVTEENGIIRRQPLYEAKGFVREEDAPRETIPLLVENARKAIRQREAVHEDPPAWALGVLSRHPEVGSSGSAGKSA